MTEPELPIRPRATEGLEVDETDDGVIIYEEARDRVHHLNPTAAVVFIFCDGTRTTEEIAREVGRVFGLSAAPVTETETAIAELAREGLVS